MLKETEQLIQLVQSTPLDASKTDRAQKRLIEAAQKARPDDLSEAVRRLAPLIAMDDRDGARRIAGVCGALVENGAEPAPMAEPLLARVRPALAKLADEPVPEGETEEAVEASPAMPSPTVNTAKPPGLLKTLWHLVVGGYRLRRALKKYAAEQAARPVPAEEAEINSLSCPMLAMFSASPSLREAHSDIGDLAKRLAERVDCCGWLDSVFEVLDDEPMLVIEPAAKQGLVGRISGVDINFTLNMLLMHHFPGQDGVPRSRLTARAASVLNGGPQEACEWVVGAWNLYNWKAIQNDGSLPSGQSSTDNWIWNEGKPGDIDVFEGRRVVLLGPPAYERSWAAQRTFAAMRPELRIERTLDATEVDEWVKKMAEANRPAE